MTDQPPAEAPSDEPTRRRRRRRSSRRRTVQTPIFKTGYRLAWRPPSLYQLCVSAIALCAIGMGGAAVMVESHAARQLAEESADLSSASRGVAAGQALADRLEASARAQTDAGIREEEAIREQQAVSPTLIAPQPTPYPHTYAGEEQAAAPASALTPSPYAYPPSAPLPDPTSSSMGYTLPSSSSQDAASQSVSAPRSFGISRFSPAPATQGSAGYNIPSPH